MSLAFNLRQFAVLTGTAIIGLSSVMTTAALGAETVSRAEWKKEYIRPSAIPFPENNPYSTEKADLGRSYFSMRAYQAPTISRAPRATTQASHGATVFLEALATP
jgi:hypothetical protein